MEKKLRVIFFNILLCILILIAIDFGMALKNYNDFIQNIKTTYSKQERIQKNVLPKFKYSLKFSTFKSYFLSTLEQFKSYPKKITTDNDKKSIMLIGCSYTAGSFLPDDNNLATKLSKEANRDVYNFAVPGAGPAAMLQVVKTKEIYEIIDKEVEYVIYFFIPHHISRMWLNKYGAYGTPGSANFVQKGDKFVEEKIDFFTYQLCRFQYIREKLASKAGEKYYNDKDINTTFDLFKLYVIEMKKEVQKHYPNAKFILVKHPSGKNVFEEEKYLKLIYYSERWKEIEDNGILVYDLKDKIKQNLSDDEYMLPDKHPTAESWDIVVPQLVKDLNL